MTEKQKELLSLLKYQETLATLNYKLNISPKQIYRKIISLENYGYNIFRKDYSTGDVQFGLASSEFENLNSKVIFTPPNTFDFRTIILSDLHLGNKLQNLKALDFVYEYAKKNNIHTIINCGDLYNGLMTSKVGTPIDTDCNTQLINGIKNHPFDPNIINFIVLGNHDYSFMNDERLNLIKYLKHYRYDLFPISYNNAEIKIKNDIINLVHPNEWKNSCLSNKITFRGHSHKIKHITSNNNMYIYVPSCSNMFYDEELKFPSILDVTFSFSKGGFIREVYITTLIFINEFIKVDEIVHNFNETRQSNEIKFEETPKVLTKKQTNYSNMSQIEKFNARYGLKK